MPKRVTTEERQAVLRMLARSEDRETIAASVGVTPGQVSAIAAHVTMGTYELPEAESTEEPVANTNLLRQLRKLEGAHKPKAGLPPILLGTDAETKGEVLWNPNPETGAANPHVLVLGESGFGKTYTISCLLGELAQHGVLSIVFDYGQGFAIESLQQEFIRAVNPTEILASRDGIDINPLQIFPSDMLGPVNVAQRVADTFARVYPRVGVQQHAVLRQAVLDVMADQGIVPGDAASWMNDLPSFADVQRKFARNLP